MRPLRVVVLALLGTTGCVGPACWCDDPDLAPPRASRASAHAVPVRGPATGPVPPEESDA